MNAVAPVWRLRFKEGLAKNVKFERRSALACPVRIR